MVAAGIIILAFLSVILLGITGVMHEDVNKLVLWGTLIACFAFVLYDNLRLRVSSGKITLAMVVSLLAGIVLACVHVILTGGFEWPGAVQAASLGFMVSALVFMAVYRKGKPAQTSDR